MSSHIKKSERSRASSRKRVSPQGLAKLQGVFYFASGLWPLMGMKSFEKVTGPKQDDWLVKTVGLLIAGSGISLLKSSYRSKISEETLFNGAWQALALGTISLFYSLRGTISKVYLLDATIEYLIAASWYFAQQPEVISGPNRKRLHVVGGERQISR